MRCLICFNFFHGNLLYFLKFIISKELHLFSKNISKKIFYVNNQEEEIKYLPKLVISARGNEILKLIVCTNDNFSDRDGVSRPKKQIHNIRVISPTLIPIWEDPLKPCDRIQVEGQLMYSNRKPLIVVTTGGNLERVDKTRVWIELEVVNENTEEGTLDSRGGQVIIYPILPSQNVTSYVLRILYWPLDRYICLKQKEGPIVSEQLVSISKRYKKYI